MTYDELRSKFRYVIAILTLPLWMLPLAVYFAIGLFREERRSEKLRGKAMPPFCDFCSCDDCTLGAHWLSHAQTDTGEWICDVCYLYDQCTTGENRAPNPCENKDCEHRPKIVSEWSK